LIAVRQSEVTVPEAVFQEFCIEYYMRNIPALASVNIAYSMLLPEALLVFTTSIWIPILGLDFWNFVAQVGWSRPTCPGGLHTWTWFQYISCFRLHPRLPSYQ